MVAPTIFEAIVFTVPLPIIFGVLLYLPYRRRKLKLEEEAEATVEVGRELAEQIADFLVQGLRLSFSHRDYCGIGLRYGEGAFVMDHVHDGELLLPSEYQAYQVNWGALNGERMEFATKGAFVTWLSEQTTNSLAGDGNQQLTRGRLLKAARFCETRPMHEWQNYAG